LIFLEPLVDELLKLWELGVETYDASYETFDLQAALVCTTSDFLVACGSPLGWKNKGKYA